MAAPHVTGSHSAKAGVQYVFGQEGNTTDFNADLVQRYRSGVVDSVAVRNTPTEAMERVNADVGIYAQDSWTIKRFTLNLGIQLFTSLKYPVQGPYRLWSGVTRSL